MTQLIKAYGQVLQFPKDMKDEDIASAIKANEPDLNPDYQPPKDSFMDKAKGAASRFAQDSLGVDMGLEASKPSPTAGDYAKGFAEGSNKLVSGVGYLAEVLGAKESGKNIRAFGDRGAAYWNSKMTRAGRDATKSQVFEDSEDSFLGVKLSDDAGKALLMGASQSIPSMFAAALPGGLAAKGIQKLAALGLAGGAGATIPLLAGTAAPVGLASQVIARTPAALGFGAAEGVAAGAMNAAEFKSSIEGMSDDELNKSPVYQILKAEHGAEDAKMLLAEQASYDVFGKTAISTGAIGALTGGGALAQAYQKVTAGSQGGVIKQILKGAGQETIQETPQSGAEAYIQNLATRDYLDPDQDPMDGVIAEALSGGAIGGFTGGLVGGGGAVNITRSAHDHAQKINDERNRAGLDKIDQAQTVDEAIAATQETVAQKPVNKDDVLKAVDPTLADLEKLTGLTPSEAISQAEIEAHNNLADQINLAQASQGNNALEGQITNDQVSPQRKNRITLPSGEKLDALWEIVDADSVKATLKSGENQPRDRTRATSDVQIQNIADNPDYDQASSSPVMNVGAPLLTHDGIIVAGNGRFEGLSQAHEQGKAAEYISALKADAANKGIDASVIDSMKKPVLVRRLINPYDVKKLAIKSNSGLGMDMSDLEQAKVDAELMKGIETLELTEQGDINNVGGNIDKLKYILSGYENNELGNIVDKNYVLSQGGLRRIKAALLAKAYGDSETLGRLIESVDDGSINIRKALTRTAGAAAKVREDIKSGALPKELDVSDSLLGAVETLANIRAKNQPLANYLAQDDIISKKLSAEEEGILQFLHDNIRSQRKLTEFLRSVYANISNAGQTTGGMFDDYVAPSKMEVINNARKQTETTPVEQEELFGESNNKASGSNAAKSSANGSNEKGNGSSEEGLKFSRSAEERLKDRERASRLQKLLRAGGYNHTVTDMDMRDVAVLGYGTQEEAEAAERIAKIFKKRIVWVKVDGSFGINGLIVPSIDDTIFIDVRTKIATHAVMGHELSHHLEQDKPAVYAELVDSLNALLKDDKGFREKYTIPEGETRENVVKEMIGDIVGDNFTKQEFWNKVAKANPSAFESIAKAIISWLKNLALKAKTRGLDSEQWVTDANKAQDIIAKAVAQYVSGAQEAASDSTKKVDAGKDSAKFHKAFHGGPHDFDKFTTDKIGTGEGAQAYGHGLYFAESRDVAEFYKEALGQGSAINRTYNIGGKNYSVRDLQEFDSEYFPEPVAYVSEGKGDLLIKELKEGGVASEGLIKVMERQVKELEEIGVTSGTGKLYEVELAPKQEDYLLWDKPLSEQSDKVKELIPKAIAQLKKSFPDFDINSAAGEGFYRAYSSHRGGNDAAASEYLHSLGIRGIKYLDGSSRGKGDGNFNYVIFHEDDVSIQAKFSRESKEDKTLIAQHNITPENLLHANRIGGLAAPSLAITDKSTPLLGFGEITLLSDKDLIDPRGGAKVFGADIYSPRYPTLTYKFDDNAVRILEDIISDGIKATGIGDLDGNQISADPIRELESNPSVIAQFLIDEGVKPKIVLGGKPIIRASLKKFAESGRHHHDLVTDQAFRKEAVKPFEKRTGRKANSDEERNLTNAAYREIDSYRDAIKLIGKTDPYKTVNALKDQVGSKQGRRDKFGVFVANLIQDSNPEEKIFKTVTETGRKYVPHTLDNVIKILKTDVRGGENFNYGLGSLRALHTPQFKSIKEIRESKNKLMDQESFAAVKEEMHAEFDAIRESLQPYGKYSGFDNPQIMMVDYASVGLDRALSMNGFDGVPDNIKKDITEFIAKLKSMPTEYFEVKLLRAVSLGEFKAAVVPKDTHERVIEILKKNGITDIRKYKSGDKKDRVEKINKLDKLFFSRVGKDSMETIQDTLTIDGTERPTRNSDGNLIHPTEEGIRKFWEWFGESKITDNEGRPELMYHGTNSDFDTFKESEIGKGSGTYSGEGFYFTPNITEAGGWAEMQGDGALAMPSYIKMTNPYSFYLKNRNWQADNNFTADLKEKGFDGVMVRYRDVDTITGVVEEDWIGELVAFNPNQIKSAIGNTGAFSKDSDDIRFSREGKSPDNWFVIEHKQDILNEFEQQRADVIFESTCIDCEGGAGFVDEQMDKSVSLAKTSKPVKLIAEYQGISRGELKDWTFYINEDYVIGQHSRVEHFFKIVPTQERYEGYLPKPSDDIRFSKQAALQKAPTQSLLPGANAATNPQQPQATQQPGGVVTDILPEETRFRKAQRVVQDKFNRFTVIKDFLAKRGINLSEQADVYAAEERYHSKVSNQTEDFREQVRNPLIEKIAKAGFTMADIADYLEAQHAEEANAAMQELHNDPNATAYGITDKEARAYLDKADKKLGRLANEFREITEKTKQLRLDNGLLNTDIVNAWDARYQHYIPVKGNDESKGGKGKGLKVNFKTKRRLGHGRRDEAVIENILMDHERAIMEVEKNRVGKHVVMMIAEAGREDIGTIGKPEKRRLLTSNTSYAVMLKGNAAQVFSSKEAARQYRNMLPGVMKGVAVSDMTVEKITDERVAYSASPMLAPNEINVYIDGHAIRVQLNDNLLAEAYGNLGIEGLGKIFSAGRIFNSYLSKVYTGYNPEFILTNIIRDFSTGIINLTGEEGIKMAAKAVANYPGAFASLLKYAVTNGAKSNRWIDAYRANGGNTGAAYLSDMERLGNEVATEYAAYQGVIANLKQGDNANAARAAGKKVFNITLKWIQNLNQAGENAMRLSAFKAMLDGGKTVNEAAHVAKNITVNFNRKGTLGAEANALYLFFNASVQGMAATSHALTKGKHKKQAWALATSMATIGYLMAASLAGGGDEDDYDKIDDYTKERNVLINTEDGFIKIPIPYGYGFFWNFGRIMADAQRKDDLGKAPWRIAASAIEELTPFGDIVGGSEDGLEFDKALIGIFPTVLKIPTQVATNQSTFSGAPLRPESQYDESQPDREKMWRGTQGTMYDLTAGWLESAMGMDVSPETLKFYTRTGTGGAGALVDTTISAAILKAEGATLDAREIPFIRKLYGELTISNDRSAYQKAAGEARLASQEFNRAKRDRDLKRINDIASDKVEMLAMHQYANKLQTFISAARDQQDAIRLSDDYTTQEKRLKLKELEAREAKLYDDYLDVFKVNKQTMRDRAK